MTDAFDQDQEAQAQDAPGPDLLLLDTEALERLAEPSVVQAAVRHSNEHRVTALDRGERGLWAEVEDEGSGDKLEVEIALDADGAILSGCDCGPSRTAPDLCVHAMAALFAYAKGQGDARQLADAAQTAIEERIAKARAEVRAEPLSESAEAAGFGLWSARSLQSATHFPVSYRVHIRSLTERANYCTCPDFATNELGTCKHIEAVLHRIQRRPDVTRNGDLFAPPAYVYLDWQCEDAPVIRLHRGAEPTSVELSPLLSDHFDADGRFKLRIPDDFLRLADQLAGRSDLLIGDDALSYARRLAEDAARAVRAAEIGAQIRAGGGRLPGVDARLYPYQVEGVAFLAGRGRGLLADDMGLGKTLQAIAAAYWLHTHDGVERVLIVCPASLKLQWAREIAKFTDVEAHIIQGPVEARGVQYRQGRGFYVVNYELVMRDHSVINSDLCPDLLILDEAQRIKNWRTKIASAVKRIVSRYAFVLTGTPLENRLEDLYSLMQVIDPRVLGPLWRYMVDFHITDERGKVLGYRNLSELRRRLATAMLRRDRSLVRDQLPERITQRIDVPMTEAQQGIHDDALIAATNLAQIMKRRPLTPSEQNRMMAALQRARMACNAAGLVDKETPGAPKLDELESILDELCRMAGLKAVIFSQWERMTELVEQRVRRMGLGCVRLHGGVPTQKRGVLIDRFRDDDAIQVFISTDAGGTGLNLQNASVLVNLDIPWNPAVLDQRIARVHRLGQRQRVQAILLIALASYEERVLELVQGKRHLFDNVVDPDATEDVVSVSKRLAEVLAEDLAKEGAEAEPEVASTAEELGGGGTPTGDASPADVPPASRHRGDSALDAAVRECVDALQGRFGARIQRILSQRSADTGGLLVVLDRVDAEDDAALESLSERVPMALIDRRTLASLARLGSSSPIADAEPVFSPEPGELAGAEHPLMRRAREGVGAATLLLQQSCPGPAAELLVSALLAAAAVRAGRSEPSSPQQAGVWIYAEALPAGWLTQEDAALLMRALALAQGAEAAPAALIRELAEEASAFVERSTPLK